MQNLPYQSNAISVSELNRSINQLLLASIPLLRVTGEISNFVVSPAGHWYFLLKDGYAQARCVMFRHKTQYQTWRPIEGAGVEVQATVGLYEARGEFQLTVDNILPSGLGKLYLAFEQLKLRLEQQGLFDTKRKRLLPTFPRRIGIITSPTGAALHDVLTTLRRRAPWASIIIYPTLVQGVQAAKQITETIQLATQRKECDTLILCRGGGSIEDLWPFNEESVAMAIYRSPIPIITGIGHETDFTIADFVADYRAATPTAAAEIVAPNRIDLIQQLQERQQRLERNFQYAFENKLTQFDYLSRRLMLPSERLQNQQIQLRQLARNIKALINQSIHQNSQSLQIIGRRLFALRPEVSRIEKQQQELVHTLIKTVRTEINRLTVKLYTLEAKLQQLNPTAILSRGYSVVTDDSGNIIRESLQLKINEIVTITFGTGSAKSQIIKKS